MKTWNAIGQCYHYKSLVNIFPNILQNIFSLAGKHRLRRFSPDPNGLSRFCVCKVSAGKELNSLSRIVLRRGQALVKQATVVGGVTDNSIWLNYQTNFSIGFPYVASQPLGEQNLTCIALNNVLILYKSLASQPFFCMRTLSHLKEFIKLSHNSECANRGFSNFPWGFGPQAGT